MVLENIKRAGVLSIMMSKTFMVLKYGKKYFIFVGKSELVWKNGFQE